MKLYQVGELSQWRGYIILFNIPITEGVIPIYHREYIGIHGNMNRW